MQYDLDPDYSAVVSGFGLVNRDLRREYALNAAPTKNAIIRRVLLVGALCEEPGVLDSYDRKYLDSVLGGLSTCHGLAVHPDVSFNVCNLVYGSNFLDPEYQRQNPADLVVISYVYNPSEFERDRMKKGEAVIEKRLRQIDQERHFLPGAWANAAYGCGAQIVSVIHFDETEVGPVFFEGGHFWIEKSEPIKEMRWVKNTRLFSNGFVHPSYVGG